MPSGKGKGFMKNQRLSDLKRFYDLMAALEAKQGGTRTLAEENRRDWPHRGIYFFQESTERRTESGAGLRIVRVGTHAVSKGSKTKLWDRLSQHRGQLKSGGGNHRGSVFRKIVGLSLLAREKLDFPTWGEGGTAKREIRLREHPLEVSVSRYIGAMPFLWLEVDDEPGANSLRKSIERNAIALLSNYSNNPPVDRASSEWLGHFCPKEDIPRSGLWNSDHVDEVPNSSFLEDMQRLIMEMK